MVTPFLNNFFLPEDLHCDMSVGFATHAFVERNQRVLQILVGRKL